MSNTMGRTGEKWTKAEDDFLDLLWAEKKTVEYIAKRLDRSSGGIRSRLNKHGFDPYRDMSINELYARNILGRLNSLECRMYKLERLHRAALEDQEDVKTTEDENNG